MSNTIKGRLDAWDNKLPSLAFRILFRAISVTLHLTQNAIARMDVFFHSASHYHEVENTELLLSEPFTSLMMDSSPSDDRHTDTYRGKNAEHNLVALRVWRSQADDQKSMRMFLRRIEKELSIWKNLEHPNVAPLHGLAFAYGMRPSSVTPFYANGTIKRYLSNHPNASPLRLLCDVAKGLAYLHTRAPPISHGDVRGCHIFVKDNGTPVISNIGTNHLPSPPNWTISSGEGTRWMAPEIMIEDSREPFEDRPEEVRLNTTPQSDVYSFGMTIYEVYSRRVPYHWRRMYAGVIPDVVRGIRPPRPDADECPGLTDDIWSLIERCWNQNPNERPSMLEVVALLEQMLLESALELWTIEASQIIPHVTKKAYL
ncbi:hypothetical protein V5O48_009910 [Marasmius crinis-equi]|uniref:Protein kinase domain-containing protein n=1 Tax=Marasmius crinis-equi TaxID=585013 RepID=A0ABR3F9V2_9AGAR